MIALNHEIGIKGKMSDILTAITTQEGLKSWWTTDVEATPQEGTQAKFGFMNRAVVFTMEVVRIQSEGVEWKCVDGPEEWVGTTQKFSFLNDEDGETLVRFTHAGWQEGSPSAPRCNTTWGHLMVTLKNYVEAGKVDPYFK